MVTSCCIHEALSQTNTRQEVNSVNLLKLNESEEISLELMIERI